MSITVPSTLPLELIFQIIDIILDPPSSIDLQSESIATTLQIHSSLACVSHVFRQHVNAHRFSTVSFLGRKSQSLADIHALLDLLRSDVWVSPNMGVARHIRKLELILGVRGKDDGEMSGHPALDDGSFTTIMNTVFRGSGGDPHSMVDYTLVLYGYTESQSRLNPRRLFCQWTSVNPDFISNLEDLLDSCIITFDLTWFSHVPQQLVKRQRVKHLKLHYVTFSFASQHIKDPHVLRPWNHLESLELGDSNLSNLAYFGDLSRLKSLTVDNSISISHRGPHWNLLEHLTLNFDNEIMMDFGIDYRPLSNLKRLTVKLRVLPYNRIPSVVEFSTQQILNVLGTTLPPLSCLEICIYNDFHTFQFQDMGFVDDILTSFDCASLDGFLVRYLASTISMIILRFGIKMSRSVGDDWDLETFRKDGLDVLRQAFPRMNAGPRQRVCDSVVSKTWNDRVHMSAVLHEGMFSVMYRSATEEGVR